MTGCEWCGGSHGTRCPIVKAKAFDAEGHLTRVEFFSLAESMVDEKGKRDANNPANSARGQTHATIDEGASRRSSNGSRSMTERKKALTAARAVWADEEYLRGVRGELPFSLDEQKARAFDAGFNAGALAADASAELPSASGIAQRQDVAHDGANAGRRT